MIGGTYVKLSAFQTFSYGLYNEHVLDFKSAGIHLFSQCKAKTNSKHLRIPPPSGSAFELCLPTLCVGLNAFYSMGQPPHNIDTNICLLTAILWTNLLQILIPISVLQY